MLLIANSQAAPRQIGHMSSISPVYGISLRLTMLYRPLDVEAKWWNKFAVHELLGNYVDSHFFDPWLRRSRFWDVISEPLQYISLHYYATASYCTST